MLGGTHFHIWAGISVPRQKRHATEICAIVHIAPVHDMHDVDSAASFS